MYIGTNKEPKHIKEVKIMANILTLEQIMNESRWVAKMQGWRQVGTYAEVGYLSDSEECRDFDLTDILLTIVNMGGLPLPTITRRCTW